MPYVSLSWLADHVELPEDATIESVAADLVAVGLEEEEIHPPKVTGPLVAGKVLSLVKETASNGKTVNYCRVDVGRYNDPAGTGKEPADVDSRGIICGAHNFEVGDTVVVSLPGAVLPGPFPIAARKTYGHISDGMICSERELGLGDDHDGIIVLDQFVPGLVPDPGEDVISLLGLGEEVLEINVTPDRGYCFSMRGIAREYALSRKVAFQDPGLLQNQSGSVPSHSEEGVGVTVDSSASLENEPICDRFITRIIRGLDPKAQTPKWMRERLEQAGVRSISLPVDVTNYVMLDLGQPMHAYDLQKLSGSLGVRFAQPNETITTIDDQERTLDKDDVVVVDSEGKRVIGLAGVMGGSSTEVDEGTTDIVLEAAHFNAKAVARTSRRHRLSSESSKRFERGVDPEVALTAIVRATSLLEEYGKAQADEHIFEYAALQPSVSIFLPHQEPLRLTGVEYSPERITDILVSIGAGVSATAGGFQVTAPSWRPDLRIPADLVEEIARLDGYDKIPVIFPPVKKRGVQNTSLHLAERVSEVAANWGLNEVLSYPFIGNAHDRQSLPDNDERRGVVSLANPLAADAPSMRTSILDTLLLTAERNASRGLDPVALFEIGRVWKPSNRPSAGIPGVQERPSEEELRNIAESLPLQPRKFAAVMAGQIDISPVAANLQPYGWQDAIAVGLRIGSTLGVKIEVARAWEDAETPKIPGPPTPKPAADPADVAPWHPGRSAVLFVRKGKTIVELGYAGELHPSVVQEYGLPRRAAAIEFDLDLLLRCIDLQPIQALRISTFPAAKTDLAVVVGETTPATDVERVIRAASRDYLEDIVLFDIYRGEQIEPEQKSLAFALTLRAPDRTLLPEEVQGIRTRIIGDLGKRLKAHLRA